MHYFFKLSILLISLLAVSTSYARCTRTQSLNAGDSYAAALDFGTLNLSSAYLQPIGTVLGHIVIPTTHRSVAPATTIWTCDEADLPNIYFLVATNGDEPFGGHVETGTIDNLADVYATWWQYVGLKQEMDGVVFSRYWKRVPIKNYLLEGGKIKIRLMDLPPLEATLYRISSLPSYSRGSFCNTRMIDRGSYKSGKLSGTNTTSSCNQPSGYIQLGGTSSVSFPWTPDKEGADSNSSFSFFAAYGMAFGLNTSTSTLSQAATCVARNATPTVNLPPISTVELRNGLRSVANFNVEIECSNSAVSGTNTDQVAIGFQPSNTAYSNAQKLGLINANGSVNYLVDDNYGSSQSTEGVGIRLENPSTNTKMHFLNQYAISGGGANAGWYPIFEGNPTQIGSQNAGYTSYMQQYNAVLEKLPNIDMPKAGTIKSRATVVVKVQ